MCKTCNDEGEISVQVSSFFSEIVPCPDCQPTEDEDEEI
jgi:DnaJ-class molecular chaperone